MSDREGQQFGNYKLIRFLGDGSFADVYLGEHIYLKTLIAVKVLRMQLQKGDIDSFFIEAHTIASLEHPHIVKVLDCGVDYNVPYLVMNYAPNGTLRQRHPNHTVLSPTVVLSYVKQVASALQYAHDRNLIHRDIKPHNMLLGPKDELWLSDFGLVLIAQSTMSQITQNTAGTPGYMAPEQYSGKPRQASDQYSLAVVVYEWLCGERPFHGSFYQLISQHKFDPAPSLREKKPFISPAVEEVVLKALAKDPHERFPSVQAFANALEQAYRSQPYLLPGSGVDLPASSSQKELPPLARQPASAPNAFNTLAPTVLFSPLRSSPSAQDVIAIALDKPSSPPEDTRAPALINTPAPIEMIKNPETPLPPVLLPPTSNEMIKNPETPLPPVLLQSHALSRRGISRRAVLVGLAGAVAVGSGAAALAWKSVFNSSGSTGTHTKALKQAATAAATPVPVGAPILTYSGQKDGVKAAAWSPTGQFIASGGVDHTVHVWNASNGQDHLIPFYTGHTGGLNSVAWSPDERYIASGSEDKTVRVWDATTGKDLFSPYTRHTDKVRSVAWSPKGQYIASGSTDHTVHVWDATTGIDLTYSPYKGHTSTVITVAWSPDGQYIASASIDKTVKVWSLTNGQAVFTLTPQLLSYYGERAVAWSPDGKYIVSGDDDHTVYLWDATNLSDTNKPRWIRQFLGHPGHMNYVQSVAWSPDGQHIASGSLDSTVKIWNVATGGLIFTYNHHNQQVWSVAWSPDGRRIASASIDGTVQIWKPL
jgi:eukaryotic-like serine/threonine-protein kinase